VTILSEREGALTQLRTVTASGLRPEHLAWARHFAAEAEAPPVLALPEDRPLP
jgi:hypothetical protein